MHVLILGTRGIPATHGGFETFAEALSLFLKERNHEVTVYCQLESGQAPGEDIWNGVRRVRISTVNGAFGTVVFDLKATWHSLFRSGVVLTLGYNTGILNFLYKLRKTPNVMNMDGLEWQRRKWSRIQRGWLWFNERAGALAATHLVADHPEIKNHLLRHTPEQKITVIPYGAERVSDVSTELISSFGLKPQQYYLVIARPEPENSILEIVSAFSKAESKPSLVVLGTYEERRNEYQRLVLNAAGPNILFPGSIYDHQTVQALRFHAKAYIHGHTVGGTNPSLVESLAAGNPIIAHSNVFNRWVAGPGAKFFVTEDDLGVVIKSLETRLGQLSAMQEASRRQHKELFEQHEILSAYEALLLRMSEQVSEKLAGPDRTVGISIQSETES